nr:AAA family ATPase [Acidimicrobiia bacterium]
MSDGTSLVTGVTCRSCGAVGVAGARFCATCGQPLTQRADERRVVTVLFADLVGFTALAERRDPEQVKNLVDRCFERLAADVADFGGRVDKFVGDAVLALFGAPLAHEDDAERAVRCALRMQRTLSDWREGTGADELQLRVGINTGEVLVGALRAGGDWTAMGDVVNTASRLQTMAEPGTVVVGPDTHAATLDAVRYTPLGELRTKGREGLVEAWVAVEPIALPGHRTRRADVPIVGRDLELGLIGSVIEAAVKRRRAATVVVVAEAGMGKSRLVEAAAERAACEHGMAVWEGRCVPYGEANVWWPVAEAVRQGCGITTEDPLATAERLAVVAVTAALEMPDRAPEVKRIVTGLLYLMGYEVSLRDIDPLRAREEAMRSVLGFVEALTHTRPVVLVVSDLHWADDLVLETIAALLDRLRGAPFVVVASARLELQD